MEDGPDNEHVPEAVDKSQLTDPVKLGSKTEAQASKKALIAGELLRKRNEQAKLKNEQHEQEHQKFADFNFEPTRKDLPMTVTVKTRGDLKARIYYKYYVAPIDGWETAIPTYL